MRRRDFHLQMAARKGVPEACIEVARRYFVGGDGFPKNHRLGLAYLQQELLRGTPAAVDLIGQHASLETLISHSVRHVLERAASRGNQSAMLKLGVWCLLSSAQRKEGAEWLLKGEEPWRSLASETMQPVDLAQLMRSLRFRQLMSARDVLEIAVYKALDADALDDARFCLLALLDFDPSSWRVQPLGVTVLRLVRLAMSTGSRLGLPPNLVEACLLSRSEQGDLEAQYVLGCAYLGAGLGPLCADELVSGKDLRRGRALLLRAADAGRPDAWMLLYEASEQCRGAAYDGEMSRFFLEKAAAADLVHAQRMLGVLLLREACSLERAEHAVQKIGCAAERGDEQARRILATLVLPQPELDLETERSIIGHARAVDPQLAARLLVARALHLTKREAINFTVKRDLRSWGVVVPGTYSENPKGRLAPFLPTCNPNDLEGAFDVLRSVDASPTLLRKLGRLQKEVFGVLRVNEETFFAEEIGRSWSHYGFGRHWAAKAGRVLQLEHGEQQGC